MLLSRHEILALPARRQRHLPEGEGRPVRSGHARVHPAGEGRAHRGAQTAAPPRAGDGVGRDGSKAAQKVICRRRGLARGVRPITRPTGSPIEARGTWRSRRRSSRASSRVRWPARRGARQEPSGSGSGRRRAACRSVPHVRDRAADHAVFGETGVLTRNAFETSRTNASSEGQGRPTRAGRFMTRSNQ